jgi:hypothetical protein
MRIRFLPALIAAATLSAFAADDRPLFTGTDLSGWKQPHGTWSVVGGVTLAADTPKAFTATPGTGAFLNSPAGKTSDLFTESEHGDCELHVEFCVPKGSNSGIYLMGRYEVQIFDSFGKAGVQYSDCGGLYQRDGKRGEVFDGKAPSVNASKAPGEWQTFDITFRAPRFAADGKKTENARFVKVVHNGQTIHENVEVDGPTRAASFKDEKPLGPIKLQGDHGPVAFRNIHLKAQ